MRTAAIGIPSTTSNDVPVEQQHPGLKPVAELDRVGATDDRELPDRLRDVNVPGVEPEVLRERREPGAGKLEAVLAHRPAGGHVEERGPVVREPNVTPRLDRVGGERQQDQVTVGGRLRDVAHAEHHAVDELEERGAAQRIVVVALEDRERHACADVLDLGQESVDEGGREAVLAIDEIAQVVDGGNGVSVDRRVDVLEAIPTVLVVGLVVPVRVGEEQNHDSIFLSRFAFQNLSVASIALRAKALTLNCRLASFFLK